MKASRQSGSAEDIAANRKFWTDAGVEFIKWSPQDVERWEESIYGAAWGKLIEKYPDVGPEMQRLLTKP